LAKPILRRRRVDRDDHKDVTIPLLLQGMLAMMWQAESWTEGMERVRDEVAENARAERRGQGNAVGGVRGRE
jgi:hypothetical protein